MSLITDLENNMLPCLSKQLLGMECPGCGLQRAAVFLIKGDFISAFLMYPALYTLILLFGFLAVNSFYKIKQANTIIIGLTFANLILILTNFLLKFI